VSYSTYPKLNLGCGKAPTAASLNVDITPQDGIDLVADIRYLHFHDPQFQSILLSDVLEHLSHVEARDLLRRCYTWLRDSGEIEIFVPNLAILAYYLSVSHYPEALKWLYGSDGTNNPEATAYHRWGYSEESLTQLLMDYGFKVRRTSMDCRKMRLGVEAYK